MKKQTSLIYSCLLLLLVFACKKYDPDCATCPCPACPIISEVIPNHGRPGDTLILKGENFHLEKELNKVFIGTVSVEEIIEGTNNQLKVIVPQISNSGQVKIKINDEKGLSSDEIPDYNAPIFTLDHFVELIAGIPTFPGQTDGFNLQSKFSTIDKIAVDNTYNLIYVIDKTNSGNKTIRKIDSTNVLTIYTSSSIASNYRLYDITTSFNDNLYINEFDGTASTSKIRYKNVNYNNNVLSDYTNWSYPDVSLGSLSLDPISGNIYYSATRAFPLSFFLVKRQIGASSFVNDTLAEFTELSLMPTIDLEYSNGHLYYASRNTISGLYSISKLSVATSQIQLIKDGITEVKGIAVDQSGRVYYSSGNQVFRISNNTQTSLIIGSVATGYNNNPTIGLNSLFNDIRDIDFDNANNLYIVDAGNFCIRRLKIE